MEAGGMAVDMMVSNGKRAGRAHAVLHGPDAPGHAVRDGNA
jgi:hypothetical protein